MPRHPMHLAGQELPDMPIHLAGQKGSPSDTWAGHSMQHSSCPVLPAPSTIHPRGSFAFLNHACCTLHTPSHLLLSILSRIAMSDVFCHDHTLCCKGSVHAGASRAMKADLAREASHHCQPSHCTMVNHCGDDEGPRAFIAIGPGLKVVWRGCDRDQTGDCPAGRARPTQPRPDSGNRH